MVTIPIENNELVLDNTKITWVTPLYTKEIKSPSELIYGYSYLEFYLFTIGIGYTIKVRNSDGNTLNIPIKSYFQKKHNEKYGLFNQVTEAIWKHYFIDKIEEQLHEWEQGKSLQIGNYEINAFEVSYRTPNKPKSIALDDISISRREEDFLILSKSNPDKFMRVVHLKEWNWAVLLTILENINEL